MAIRPIPSADELRQFLDYDPATGLLRWKRRSAEMMPNAPLNVLNAWNAKFAGEVAGWQDESGYIVVSIANKRFAAHRLIWKMEHGGDPLVIDHVNGASWDNRLCNLRSVRQDTNLRNCGRQSNNASGATGVFWLAKLNKWGATIKYKGRSHHVGQYETFNDAVTARRFAERVFGFHPNHGRRESISRTLGQMPEQQRQ